MPNVGISKDILKEAIRIKSEDHGKVFNKDWIIDEVDSKGKMA